MIPWDLFSAEARTVLEKLGSSPDLSAFARSSKYYQKREARRFQLG
jgi:hypothetical protein